MDTKYMNISSEFDK